MFPQPQPQRFPPVEYPMKQISNHSVQNISEAEYFLNLPVWSRSYKKCTDPESRVSCEDILKSYNFLKNYENTILSEPEKDRKYLILQPHEYGMGNRMETEATVFVLCLMSHRMLLVDGTYLSNNRRKKGTMFHSAPSVIHGSDNFPKHVKIPRIPFSIYFDKFSLSSFRFLKYPTKIMLISSYYCFNLLYTNQKTQQFLQDNFGDHALYFISNYISRIPKDMIQKFVPYFNQIPKTTTIIGVHVRMHTPNSWYSYSLQQTQEILFRNLDHILQRNLHASIAFATDNQELFQKVIDRYHHRILHTKAVRLPDFDHTSALADFLFLHFSDDFVGTFASTFSHLIYARNAIKPLILEKDAPYFIPFFHSEASPLIGIYQIERPFLPFVKWNVRIKQTSHVPCLRQFYQRYII
jgi:hypothetical protein